jgi:hypothetical protein
MDRIVHLRWLFLMGAMADGYNRPQIRSGRIRPRCAKITSSDASSIAATKYFNGSKAALKTV